MTKASLRRQELREQQTAADSEAQIQNHLQATEAATLQQHIPHMDPPPAYDAPHLPAHATNNQNSNNSTDRDSGCWNSGPGKTDGCMNHNSGYRGLDFVVGGCWNVDSRDGCMNYRSEDGCMNYESQDGCMNYKSHDGCMNYEVSSGSGCMNYRTTRGGCMQCGSR